MALYSEAWVTALAATAACDIQNTRTDDDSIDCDIKSRRQGRPRLEVQLKATQQVRDTRATSADFAFSLSRKNYDDLRVPMSELVVPRLLVVLLMPTDDTDWVLHGDHSMTLRHAAYFLNLRDYPDVTTESKTVHVPWANHFTATALDSMMDHIAVHKDLP